MICTTTLLAGDVPRANAQPADPPPDPATVKAARSYVNAGLQAQNAGDYDTAILLYEKAYELIPHPSLIFNIAQAHRLAGHSKKALALYRKYLRAAPRGTEVATARDVITELEAKLRAEAEQAEQTEQADDDPPVALPTAVAVAEPAPAKPTHVPAIAANAGLGIANRDLHFGYRAGLGNPPPSVDVTEIATSLTGEAYPFALDDQRDLVSGIGVAVAYQHSLGNKVNFEGLVSPAHRAHLELGARYRFVTGGGIEVALGGNYFRSSYTIDPPMIGAIDAPNVAYTGISATAGLRLPVTSWLTFAGHGDVLFIRDPGDITAPDRYGKATAYGFHFAAGAQFIVSPRFRIDVGVSYDQVTLTFDGTGELSNQRDGDASTQDVMRSDDRTLDVTASFGFTY